MNDKKIIDCIFDCDLKTESWFIFIALEIAAAVVGLRTYSDKLGRTGFIPIVNEHVLSFQSHGVVSDIYTSRQ